MAYLNTTSGLGGFLDQLTQALDQRAQVNTRNRDLVAGGVLSPDQGPGPSILSQIQGAFGLGGQPQAPVAPAGPGAPMQLAGGAPPAPQAPMPAPVTPVAASPLSPQAPTVRGPPAPPQAAYAAMPAGPVPTFAAAGGNAQQALAFYQSKGLSPIAAAALVGGFTAESGKNLNTLAANPGDGSDGSTSQGIAQWNGDRARALHQFAAANGLDPADINTQLQFSWAELNGPEKGTLAALQQARDPIQATAAALGYERPAGWSAQNPFGAKTFGSRLAATGALAGGGVGGSPAPLRAAAGAAGPYGAVDPNAFARQGGAMPTFAASGAGGQLSPATQFANLPNPGTSATTRTASNPPPGALGFASSPVAAAPASQAIAAAQTGDDEADDGVSAPAAPVAAIAPLPTAPGVVNAQSIAAPQMQAPNPAAQVRAPSMQQIQALIQSRDEETHRLGLALWQSALTPKDGFTLSEGQRRYNAQGQVIAGVPDKPMSLSAGATVYDPSTGKALYTAPAEDKSTEKGFTIQIVGEDQFGNKQYGKVNKSTGEVIPLQGMPGQTAAGTGSPAGVMDLHGKDFLATLDPNTAGQVKAIVEGRAPYPTGMFAKTALGQKLAQYVTQTDPTFETGNAESRNRTRFDFKSGKIADQITAGNTAIKHLGELSDAAEQLANGPIPLLNEARNAIGTNTGSKRVTDFNNILGHFSEEAVKFYRGSGGTEADIQRDLANMNANQSPEQLRSAIEKNATLMRDKIGALQDRWRTGMGPLVDDFPIVQPTSLAAVNKIYQRAGVPIQSPSAPSTNPAGSGDGAMAQGAQPPVRVNTFDDASKLAPGTVFVTPDNEIRVRH